MKEIIHYLSSPGEEKTIEEKSELKKTKGTSITALLHTKKLGRRGGIVLRTERGA